MIPFGSIHHARIAVCSKLNFLSIKVIGNDIDPNNNLVVQRFSHLEIPTKYQYMDLYYKFDTRE